MKLLLLALLLPTILNAQTAEDRALRRRQDAIEEIMRLQDLRTLHDGKLLRYLGDPDPAVRRHATLAYGTLQDTSVIPRLLSNLQFSDSATQLAAAWALGQTATMLGTSGKQELQRDIIWKRLDWTGADSVLIEELGKFGDETALNDLINKYRGRYPRVHAIPLAMSVARFAIRGIRTTEATQLVITLLREPGVDVRWRAMYALMRIGDHQEVRAELSRLAQSYRDDDPRVRMHLTTLLGKLKDPTTSLEPLMRLAEYDADWRVRVNALRALGNFDLNSNPAVAELLTRHFLNENDHLAITAINSLASSNYDLQQTSVVGKIDESIRRRVLEILTEIVRNEKGGYRLPVQGEAAIALGKLGRGEAIPILIRSNNASVWLQSKFIEAAASTGAPEVQEFLEQFLDKKRPQLFRAALDGLLVLARENPSDTNILSSAYEGALLGLASRDVALVTTAASVLSDSLLRRPDSWNILATTLSTLRLPADVEAMQATIGALGTLGDRGAVPVLRKQLEQPDRTIVVAAATALQQITGDDYSKHIPRYSAPLFADHDFAFLRSLPDTLRIRIETIRGDIEAELYKEIAPFTVLNIIKLSRRGFYRGLVFHRVVPNFVVQGGDPRGDGWGGPGYAIRSEFSPLTYDTGVLGIASSGKDTEGSQFFITHSPHPHLDGRYTIFGRITKGMDVVDRIQVLDRIFDLREVR